VNTTNLDTILDTSFQALGHTKRRDMVYYLSFRPATVGQLADEFGLSLPAMHKHIRLLETAGLITRRKVGRTNFVALNRQGLSVAQGWMMQFRTDWGNDDETLENYIVSLKH
jgi:DNA-binding transcriptional ArsR family regulator